MTAASADIHSISNRRQDTVGYSRLRPQCRHLVNSAKHTHCLWFCIFALLCEKNNFIHKLEVHNVLHWHQTRTERMQQVTRTENWVKFGGVVFEICEQTNKETDRYADHNTLHPYWGW